MANLEDETSSTSYVSQSGLSSEAQTGEQCDLADRMNLQESGALSAESTYHDQEDNTVNSGGEDNVVNKNNKKNATRYLDQVKLHFREKPKIYNKFLEIMKEFKAQAIDTDLVIERVTSLFKDHPKLIEGFNTFLPHDQRIKTKNDLDLKKTSSAHVGSSPCSHGIPQYMSHFSGFQNFQSQQHQATRPFYNYAQPSSSGYSKTGHMCVSGTGKLNTTASYNNWNKDSGSYSYQPVSLVPNNLPFPSTVALQTGVGSNHNRGSINRNAERFGSIGRGGILPNIEPSAHPQQSHTDYSHRKKTSLEIIKAVSYVRKIQERFCKQPEVYQAFVDILGSHQREQKSIKEVYERVTSLFNGHQDLLDELARFIPNANKVGINSNGKMPDTTSSLASVAQTTNNQYNIQNVYSTPPVSGQHRYVSGNTPQVHESPMENEQSMVFSDQEKPISEIEFFERVKQEFNNNERLYNEFLKCLNWYTQDILSKTDLVRLVRGFIGSNERLFNWFKLFVGFDGDEEMHSLRENEDTMENTYSVSLNDCKRLGSYRILPEGYKNPVCSGRTAICKEILNDELVSCSSFDSEDGTFISSRNNANEETLFRCEDERYELDLFIDSIYMTIQNLEVFKAKMDLMDPKDAGNAKLDHRLNGFSKFVHVNIIKKIYEDHAEEMIENLTKHPYITVPIVIKRLRQKYEEWRLSQREWNVVWRDVHFKNYYKALDHQGVHFKTVDKKIISVKGLVNEIQGIYQEQILGNSGKTVSLLPSNQGLDVNEYRMCPRLPYVSLLNMGSNRIQMEFYIDDLDVVSDILNLLFYLNIKVSTSSFAEKKAVMKFMNNFLLDFFYIKNMTEIEVYENLESYEIEKVELVYLNVGKSLKEHNLYSSVIYGNEQIYCLFRVFQVIYHRLSRLKKQVADTTSAKPLLFQKKNYIAESLNISRSPVCSETEGGDYYLYTIKLLKKLINNEIDQNSFEEKVRLIFEPNSYLIYTMDRIVYFLLKQTLGILNDISCEHFIALYDSFKRHNEGMVFSEYTYKMAAKSLSGNHGSGNLFRVESQTDPDDETNRFCLWLKFSMFVTSSEEDGDKCPASNAERCLSYLEQFVDVDCNPEVLSNNPPVFLTKHFRKCEDSNRLEGMIVDYNLECRICVRTLKMFFVSNSEDFIFKLPDKRYSSESLRERVKKFSSSSSQKFHRFVDNWLKGTSES